MKSKGMKITAIAAATLFLVIVALPHLVDVDRFRPELESKLASTLGREVHVGHMELSFLAGGARVDQISVADDPAFSKGNFLQARSLGVGVSFLSLIFSHSVHVTSLTLDEPHLTLIKSAKGQWNFASLGGAKSQNQDDEEEDDPSSMSLVTPAASPATSIVLDRLKISNATIEMPSGSSKGATLKNINVDVKNVSFEGAMSFLLSAHTDSGKLELEGEAGPVNRDDPERTPFHATIKASKADLAQLASLASSSGLGGMLNVDGSVISDGRTVHSEGNVSAQKLRLMRGAQAASQTVSLRYATDYSVAKKTGMIRRGEITVGSSPASLSGSYDVRGKNPSVHIKISGSHLPLDTVEGVLGTLGVELPGGSKLHDGTVDGTVVLDGPIDRLVTSGNAQIADAHLAGFDLGSKLAKLPGMSSLKDDADLSIVNLSTRFRIDPSTTHISEFKGQFAGIGSITGDGDVSASNQLQFKMVAHVADDGVVRFGLNHVGLKNLPNEIPFQVVGTTSAPVIIPDLSGIAKKTATELAKNAAEKAAKNAAEKAAKNAAKNTAKTTAKNAISKTMGEAVKSQPTASEQASSNKKKGGFFHNIFHHKDKQNKSNNPQLASSKSKF